MAKLNQAEQQILRNPPTPHTWACGRKYNRTEAGEDGSPAVIEHTCRGINSGKYKVCTFCRRPKPSKPKLLYPTYLAACKKAGIEPGTRWPVREITDAPVAKPRRRKGA